MNKKFCVKFLLALGWMVLSGGAFAGESAKGRLHYQLGHRRIPSDGPYPSALHVVGKGAGPVGTFADPSGYRVGSVSFDLQTLDTGISLPGRAHEREVPRSRQVPQAQLTITELKLPRPLNAQTTALSGVPFQGILEASRRRKVGSRNSGSQSDQSWYTSDEREFFAPSDGFGIDVPKYMGITVADDVQVMVMTSAQLH